MSSLPYEQLCHRFSFDEILSATQNFDDALVIGQGGFGKVYKATINVENGATVIVAVKRLDSSSTQGALEFRAEIEMLSKLRHCNLVSLIGYCNDNSEMILIYEFMPQGTLDDHLHKYGTNLCWVQRLKLSIGAARGLHYLHTGTGSKHGVIHRDVKSSNILLDEDYTAKISDFGLSKIGPTNQSATYVNTLVKGTFGYLDPDYFLTGRLTRKTDVFAFGVVLFELLCGRQALDATLDEKQCSLANWAHECIEEGKLDQIVDSNIKGQISPKCLKVFVQIADSCLRSRSKERPTMAEVLVALERSLSLQDKFDNHVRPAGILAFTRVMKGFFISPEVNSVNHATLSKEDSNDHHEVPPVGKIQIPTHDLKMFSYSELESATKNFMRSMRFHGEFGEVFEGWVNEKTYVPSDVDAALKIAVKRLYRSKTQSLLKEESVDFTILREFSHPNLVKLLGYCFEDEEVYLVYEFMENGSLYTHLFTKDKLPLMWKTRVKIAVGVAEGLYFLSRTQEGVDNHPLSLRNILLDRDINAKLSGFEVTKLLYGNSYKDEETIDPLYFYPRRNMLKAKGNIHALGEVLIQLLTGQSITKSDLANLKESIIMYKNGEPSSFWSALDPCLPVLDNTTVESAAKLAALAFHCLDVPSNVVNHGLDLLREVYINMTEC